MSGTARQVLLRQASKLIGPDELAVRLNVPKNLLEAWIRGLSSMPDRKLLALADLIDGLGGQKKK